MQEGKNQPKKEQHTLTFFFLHTGFSVLNLVVASYKYAVAVWRTSRIPTVALKG